jgi:hypothetical protein
MQLRKVVAPVLAAVLLAAVGAGIWYSNREVAQQASAQLELSKQATLRGVIGSEKEAFFADPRVQQALAKHGLTVNVEKAGSRVIATRYEPKQYDFGFPSGAPAGNQLKALAKSSNVHTPF